MRHILFLLQTIRFIPHMLVYILFRARVLLDLDAWISSIGGNSYAGSRFKSYCWLLVQLPEYRTVLYYRMCSLGNVLRLFASPMPTCFLTGTLSADIGPGLVIHHGHSMRLGASRVGADVHVWHNVTVGKSRPGGKLPVIGNHVRIFTGSVVLGDISIGDDVVIGACTLVMKSVPDGCVVVGNPARIVRRNGQRCDEML